MVCKKCGFTQDINAIFCSNCGVNLKETEVVENATENQLETNTETNAIGDVDTNTVVDTEINNDVEANKEPEVKQDIEAEIKAEINQILNSEVPVVETTTTPEIESLNTTQSEKVQLTKTETTQSGDTQTTQGETPNVAPAPEKKSSSMKTLVIILAGLTGVLVIAIIAVVFMFFMKPSLGRATVKTTAQITKELDSTKTGSALITDVQKINDGSFRMNYYMDGLLESNGYLNSDAKNIAISMDYYSEDELFEYYISGEISSEQFVMNLLSMKAPGYNETYVLAIEENNKQLLTDIAAVFAPVASTKGVKVQDGNFDYEYKFTVDAYELTNVLTAYNDRQAKLQNDFLKTVEFSLKELNPEDAGKVYTALTGEPTNFYIDYLVQNYNTQIGSYNAYITDYINMYVEQYELSMESAVSEFDVQQGDIFDVTVKTTDGLITYVELADDVDQIVIEANDFTSYLQSSYTFYVKGENETNPLDVKLNITPEKWIIGAYVGEIKAELNWDLVLTEDNLSLAVNDGYTDETVTGTLTGDYSNGITLDMKDFGKLVLEPIVTTK